jgi:anthranilate phosphoribosyltransferase
VGSAFSVAAQEARSRRASCSGVPGAALYAADVTENLARGIALARDIIASGEATRRMSMLVKFAR